MKGTVVATTLQLTKGGVFYYNDSHDIIAMNLFLLISSSIMDLTLLRSANGARAHQHTSSPC